MAESNNTQAFINTDIPSDWEVSLLDDLTQRGSGHTPDKSFYEYYDGGIKWISLADSYRLDNGFISETEIEISELGVEKSSAVIHPIGTVLMSRDAGVGKSAVMAVNMAVSQHFIVWRCKKDRLDNWYLYHWLQYKKEYFERQAVGSTIKTIGLPLFKKLKITHPSYTEQKAIAQVLSTADAAIHTTEKLIVQKELRKKWLMQQLLTGKKRLNGFQNNKWRTQPLEDFIKPVIREVAKPSIPYLGIGLRSHGKGTFLKYDEQPEKNSMDKFYVVRPNDLIVNITFAWEQAIAIVKPEDDGALASHRFPTYTFLKDKGHPDFFRFFILQPRMKFMLQMISPGGAGRNRVMSKSDFIKLEFHLPEYEEQTAIAQVLQAADKEISLLKAKAEKLREQKKGLMQVLLTGKVRLKIND